MSVTLQLMLLLGIIIFSAKLAGYVSVRLGQPAVLGELLVGLGLGPTGIDLLHISFASTGLVEGIILEIGELGVIFLMFVAGLEVDLEGMIESGRQALLSGTLGVGVPILFGTITALFFNYSVIAGVFIGITLSATSVSISAQTLYELGFLRSKEGLVLLGAAVFDDVLVILVFSIVLAMTGGNGAGSNGVGMVILRMFAFFTIATAAGVWLIPHLTTWIEQLPISQGVIALVITVTFLFAWSAEVVGQIAAITGAFLAGIFFARTSARHTIKQGMHSLTYAFFVPIFLINIGLKANARSLGEEGLAFAGAVILVAILGKVVGCGLGARLGGLTSTQSLRVGIGMISRGEVGLIIAAIELDLGLINQSLYSVMVVMVLATTLVTPILLRGVFPRTTPALEEG